MKIFYKSRTIYLIAAFFTGIVPVALYGQQFSVDRLYPENWYTKAREHCLFVWSILDAMIQRKKHDVVPHYFIDISIGQLVFAKSCIQNIIHHNFAIVHDDIMHLSHIVSTIEERCIQLPLQSEPDKVHVLKKVIEKVKKKVEQLAIISIEAIPNQ